MDTVVHPAECRRVETRLLPVFKNFINDTNADVRALACKKLPVLSQTLE